MIAYGMYYRKFIESFFLNSLLRKFIKTNLKHYLLYLKIHFWFKIVITYGCFSLKFTLVFKKRCRLLVWRSSLSDSHTVCTGTNLRMLMWSIIRCLESGCSLYQFQWMFVKSLSTQDDFLMRVLSFKKRERISHIHEHR